MADNRELGEKVMRVIAGVMLLVGAILIDSHRVEAADLVVYKSPTCGCCNAWIDHLKENGFTVETHDQQNMSQVKDVMGVPRQMRSCHTAKAGDYVIEGHVPADLIVRLLKEKPQVRGLAVPGMPMGSPGMEGHRRDPYDILAFKKDGGVQVYGSRNQ